MPPNDKVIFGATVTVINLDTDETRVYQIVGDDEADVKSGKISVQSPVGKALIGKRVGDSVSIVTPSKTVEYEILKITFE
ncbi:MAG: GreA/GreB family elongation factor [Candidatus Manganitrophus sp.]|nr:MAG: GreA/GreB family elongation factor [Candidatus Manganitrophus sp.]